MSTEAALAARRRSTEAALGRVRDAIARLRREKAQVSVAAISRRADVSRTFLYGNPDARAAVAAAIAQAGEQRSRILDAQDDEPLGFMHENRNLRAALHARARASKNIELIWKSRVVRTEFGDHGVIVALDDGRIFKAPLLKIGRV